MNEQVKVTITPNNAADYAKAAELEKYLEWMLGRARSVHREGLHGLSPSDVCPYCIGLEQPPC